MNSNEISYAMNGALVQLAASSPSVISPSVYPLSERSHAIASRTEEYCQKLCNISRVYNEGDEEYTKCVQRCLQYQFVQ